MKVLHKRPPKTVIVCTELHKDGTPHVHIYLLFTKIFEINSSTIFDAAWPGHHCNIGKVRHNAKTLQYIQKAGDYILFGITQDELDLLTSGVSVSMLQIATAIGANPNIDAIALEFPAQFLQLHRGIRALCEVHRRVKHNHVTPYTYPAPSTAALAIQTRFSLIDAWFRLNFLSPHPKPIRSPQLWMHGPTQTGKTRMLAFLRKHWRGFLLPRKEDYYNGYNDDDVTFIYHDEFTGGKRISFLNSLLGGDPMNMAGKGTQYTKLTNKPVVLVSNLSPEMCYSRVSMIPLIFDAFKSRFIEYNTAVLPSLHPYVDFLMGITTTAS